MRHSSDGGQQYHGREEEFVIDTTAPDRQITTPPPAVPPCPPVLRAFGAGMATLAVGWLLVMFLLYGNHSPNALVNLITAVSPYCLLWHLLVSFGLYNQYPLARWAAIATVAAYFTAFATFITSTLFDMLNVLRLPWWAYTRLPAFKPFLVLILLDLLFLFLCLLPLMHPRFAGAYVHPRSVKPVDE